MLSGTVHLISHFSPVVGRFQPGHMFRVFAAARVHVSWEGSENYGILPSCLFQDRDACPKHLKLSVPRGQNSLSIDMILSIGVLGMRQIDALLRASHVEAIIEQLENEEAGK
jgi:hypothetical protein